MAKLLLQQNSFHKEETFSDSKWLWNSLWSSSVIVFYLVASIGLTFYQKWCIEIFVYPLTMVICHFTIKWILCIVIRNIMNIFLNNRTVSFISFKNEVTRIVPVGVCSALDIAFSNLGLGHIMISLYTMTKSSTIIFILCFSLMFKLEKKSCFLIVIVAMISGGLLMFTYKAVNFDLLGFLLVLFASFISGLRWTLAQVIMQRSDLGLKNPVDMLYYVQPWMLLTILPFALVREGSYIIKNWDDIGVDKWLAVGGGSLIAFGMEIAEYLVVVNTSSLTLSIAGIFKEVCILILAVLFKGDQMSMLNFIGLLLCLGGILFHIIHKARVSAAAADKPFLDEVTARFLLEGSTSSDDETGHEDSSTEVLFSVLNSRDR
ncbi:solute carrier family 35 member C2-like [Lycorma delicatula]|uniref:solute carrier family 35 member C2-like n=1 Tax=Lycorma delicatula TaxID=130591 RepID=UPI003F510DE6